MEVAALKAAAADAGQRRGGSTAARAAVKAAIGRQLHMQAATPSNAIFTFFA